MPEEPVDPRNTLDAFQDTAYGAMLRDDGRRRQLVYEALAASDDPMTKEIGEQLAAGVMEPGHVLAAHHYRSFIADAFARAESFDVVKVRSELEAAISQGRVTDDPERDLRDATKWAGSPQDRGQGDAR